MLVLAIAGCAGPLEPGFEAELDQGWVCEGWGQVGPPSTGDLSVLPVFYVALDPAEDVRVQVSLYAREATFPVAEGEGVGDDYFFVYTGARLGWKDDNHCDDMVTMPLVPQRLDYVYTAISGTARAVEDGDRIGIEMEGIVLHPDNRLLGARGAPGWKDLPDVALGDGTLPSVPVTPN